MSSFPANCRECYAAMAAEVTRYREFLESHLEKFTRVVTYVVVVFVALLGVVGAFLGIKTYREIGEISEATRQDVIRSLDVLVAQEIDDDQVLSRSLSEVRDRLDQEVSDAVAKFNRRVEETLPAHLDRMVADVLRVATPATLKRVSAPLGAMLPYAGPLESEAGLDLEFQFSNHRKVWLKGDNRNWYICNGATLAPGEYHEDVRDADGNLENGFQVPDLMGLFTRGASRSGDFGRQGGAERHLHGVSIRTRTGPAGESAVHVTADPRVERVASVDHAHDVGLDGLTQEANGLPPYMSVVYVIRVK